MSLVKSIVFVDGENLTLRFQSLRDAGRVVLPNITHIPDVFVWQPTLPKAVINTDVIRVNYYTSMAGDENAISALRDRISSQQYWMQGDYYGYCQLTPRVFKKEQRSRKSRLVDINIAIDVLRHAYTNAVDVVYLFSGDGDFVSLVEEVTRSGRRICVSAFSSGLEPRLCNVADRFTLLDNCFFAPEPPQPEPGILAPTASGGPQGAQGVASDS